MRLLHSYANYSTRLSPSHGLKTGMVPVFKKDNKEYAENYRSISLLCLVSKVIECCMFNSIKDHVYSLINSSQHGFVTRQLCVTHLVEALDYIMLVRSHLGYATQVWVPQSKELICKIERSQC